MTAGGQTTKEKRDGVAAKKENGKKKGKLKINQGMKPLREATWDEETHAPL